jgi:hypothetical protein
LTGLAARRAAGVAFFAFAFAFGFLRETVFAARRATTFAARRAFFTTRLAVRFTARRVVAGTTFSAAPAADCATDDVVEAAASPSCVTVLTVLPRALPTISAERVNTSPC